MIFCTVGTTAFPFYRIVHALDKALVESNEKLILQAGQKNYEVTHRPMIQHHEIAYGKIIDYLSRARAVVCHGGAGTLLLALRYAAVKPFVLPRLALFQEHIDDHQVYFSEYMHSRGFIITSSSPYDFVDDLRAYLDHPPHQKLDPVDANRKQFETRLREFSNI